MRLRSLKKSRHVFWVFLLWAGWAQGQYVPPNSAPVTRTVLDSTGICDYMFFATFRFILPTPFKHTLYLADRNADVVWYYEKKPWMVDFKLHPNGQMSFNQNGKFYILDSTFSLVDSFKCNNANTDIHDFHITPNGHYWFICTEDSTMDLSGILTRNGDPGSPNATVRGVVLQELDANRNLVADWHGFDHFDIADSDTIFFSNPAFLELNHSNSIFVDAQGDVLLSSRANHEVTYIDWPGGDVLWRLGGPNNEFTFLNDPANGINAQHDARFLPNGDLSIFDNGGFRSPGRARGVVYTLDTAARTATVVQEFVNPNLNSTGMGNFDIRPNGDVLINWGEFTPNSEPNLSFFKADSSKTMEMKFQDTYWTYRAVCADLPWTLLRPTITCMDSAGAAWLVAPQGHGDYLWSTGDTGRAIVPQGPGSYQVFVPRGIGRIGSPVFHFDGSATSCSPAVATPEPTTGQRPEHLVATYDLMGRPVRQVVPGRIYFEVYDSGRVRKRMVR